MLIYNISNKKIFAGCHDLGAEARNVVHIPCNTAADCPDPANCLCLNIKLCGCHPPKLNFGAEDLVRPVPHDKHN